jgi:hypothetical protein
MPDHETTEKEGNMEEKESQNQKPDQARLKALKNLPSEIMQSLSKEEVKAFLFMDVWPDSLKEKLKAFMVEEP